MLQDIQVRKSSIWLDFGAWTKDNKPENWHREVTEYWDHLKRKRRVWGKKLKREKTTDLSTEECEYFEVG